MSNQRFRKPPPLILPPYRNPVEPAVARLVLPADIIESGCRRRLPSLRIFDKNHPLYQLVLFIAVVPIPGFQALFISRKFLRRHLNINPLIPISRLKKYVPVSLWKRKVTKLIQIPFQKQFKISDTLVVVIELYLHPSTSNPMLFFHRQIQHTHIPLYTLASHTSNNLLIHVIISVPVAAF